MSFLKAHIWLLETSKYTSVSIATLLPFPGVLASKWLATSYGKMPPPPPEMNTFGGEANLFYVQARLIEECPKEVQVQLVQCVEKQEAFSSCFPYPYCGKLADKDVSQKRD